MYFVAYFIEAKVYKVVPHSWIKNVSQHLEKFMNNGLNSNQMYTVYWTNSADAYDDNGIPKTSFRPNFDSVGGGKFPEDGLYRCYLKRFKGMVIFSYFCVIFVATLCRL